MELSKITTGVIILVVCAVLFGALVAPTISSVNEDLGTTYTNVGSNNLSYTFDGEDDYSLESNPNLSQFKINGKNTTVRNGTLITTDQCRVTLSGHYTALYDQTGVRSSNDNTSNVLVTVSYTASTGVFVYTVYSGLTSDTAVASSYTYTVGQRVVYMNPAGDYVAITNAPDEESNYPTIYVNDVSQIVAGGAYTTGDLDTGYFVIGDSVSTAISTITGTVYKTQSSVSGYNNLYTVTDFYVEMTDGNTTETYYPYTLYAPATVKGHTSTDDMYGVLFSIIPILILVSLVMCAVYFVARGRAD